MKKDSYYFSHDSNARYDVKIKALRRKYGLEGYGRFWVTVEMLREQTNYKLLIDEFLYETLADEYNTTVDETKKFIEMCCKLNLLQIDNCYLWSDSLLHRMDKLEVIRQKRIEAGRKSAESRSKRQSKD